MTTTGKSALADTREPLGQRPIWMWLVLAETALFITLTIAVTVSGSTHSAMGRAMLAAAAVVMIAEIATLLAANGVWSVARMTFMQCMRTRVAVVAIVILGGSLAVLPWTMAGDGTLAGKIRSLLSYGTSITTLLLSLVTIFMACHIVSTDMAKKYIYISSTKPVARWQYLLGRWLGLLGMNVLLLAASSGTVYGLAQYLRGEQELLGSDRREVETEIFAARARVWANPVNVEQKVAARIETLKQEGHYDSAVEGFKSDTNEDIDTARRLLEADIRKQELTAATSATPGGSLNWTFSKVAVSGKETAGAGKVDDVEHLKQGFIRIAADKSLLGWILQGTPVRINDVVCRAEEVTSTCFVGRFFGDSANRPQIAGLARGQAVEVLVDPVIQINYKPSVTGQDGTTPRQPSTWIVTNPVTRARLVEDRMDPVDRHSTLTVSARCVSDDGRVSVQMINRANGPLNMHPLNISVLFPEGSFEGNFFRGSLLILLQLAFVAAIGVLAGSIASFPVGSLMCFGILPFCMVRWYLFDSVATGEAGVTTTMGAWALNLASVALPDFASTWPSDQLADGIYIPWPILAQTAVIGIGLRVAVALALACAALRRRELARVQVN